MRAIGFGDPDRHAAAAGKPVEIERLAKLGNDPRRKLRKLLRACLVVHQDDEFVAADASDRIFFVDIAGQDFGGVHEHRVACGMSQRIVDLLETVEIEVKQGEFSPAGSARQGVELHVELTPIGQQRQRVMQRVVFDPALGNFEFAVLGVRFGLGLLQFHRECRILRHIKGQPDEFLRAVLTLMQLADGAHVADRTVRLRYANHQCLLRLAAEIRSRCVDRDRSVFGQEQIEPAFLGYDAVGERDAIQLAHARIPRFGALSGRIFPYSAAVGGKCEVELAG
ncbi:hypothetical protein D3C73_868020 [compost metagenome]